MMYICFDDAQKTPDLTWYIGSEVPLTADEARKVVLVQADGHELDYIFLEMDNLPRTKHPVQRWYGDHAKFIAGNIYHKRLVIPNTKA